MDAIVDELRDSCLFLIVVGHCSLASFQLTINKILQYFVIIPLILCVLKFPLSYAYSNSLHLMHTHVEYYTYSTFSHPFCNSLQIKEKLKLDGNE